MDEFVKITNESHGKLNINTVRDKHLLSELLELYNGFITNILESENVNPIRHLEEVEASILYLLNDFILSDSTPEKLGSIVSDVYQSLQGSHGKSEFTPGLAIDVKDIDQVTKDMQGGGLILVEEKPLVDSSSFVVNMAQKVSMQDSNSNVTLLFSLKEESKDIAMRFLVSEACIDMEKLCADKLSSDDWRRLEAASNALADANIFIEHTPCSSALELCVKCRYIKRQTHRLDLVLVDNLQLMDAPVLNVTMYLLKELAEELDVPVVLLS